MSKSTFIVRLKSIVLIKSMFAKELGSREEVRIGSYTDFWQRQSPQRKTVATKDLINIFIIIQNNQ